MSIFGSVFGNAAADKMLASESGYGNAAQSSSSEAELTARQQAYNQAMHDLMRHTAISPTSVYKDPTRMGFTLKEIDNGYLVVVEGAEVFVKDLNEVGGVIVARWAAKQLER